MTRSQNYLSTYLLLCNVTVFYLCECAMKGRSKKDERIATEVVFRVYSLPISVGVTGVCFPRSKPVDAWACAGAFDSDHVLPYIVTTFF